MYSTSVVVVVMFSALLFGACNCETSELVEAAASNLEIVMAASDSAGIVSALAVVTREFFDGLMMTR